MIYNQYQQYKQIVQAETVVCYCPTMPDIEGPFYKAKAPYRNKLVDNPTLTLSGRIMDTKGALISSVMLDFWQANEKGEYDNEGFNLRGQFASLGEYQLFTIKPGYYQIDEHEFRCAHVHVKVTAYGFKPLTTQLYFSNDPYNDTDHWFDAKRIIKYPVGTFDFVLESI